MSEEVLINITPQETRVAVVENGVLQEVHVERARFRGIVGNIYKGKVVRILPGMQAAFVDIGMERTAFLHAADMWRRHENGFNGFGSFEHPQPRSPRVTWSTCRKATTSVFPGRSTSRMTASA